MANFTYDVKKTIGTIGSNGIEMRVISWNGNADKYDLRGWYKTKAGEERCKKGITMTESDVKELCSIMQAVDIAEAETLDIPDSDGYINVIKHYGTFQKTQKAETRVQYVIKGNGDPVFDISVYVGDYVAKSVSFTEDEFLELKDLLWNMVTGAKPAKVTAKKTKVTAVKPTKKAVKAEPVVEEEETVDEPAEEVSDVDDRVVRSLTSIPVNDGNYPLKTATAEELRKAIAIMEASPTGNKVRLTRCKAKLAMLDGSSKKVTKFRKKADEPKKTTKSAETPKKDNVITFPVLDEDEFKKLEPTGEHHTYEEAEDKMNAERAKFKGDRDTEYVIDGILEACVSDQDFLDNVMRPEKTYMGVLKYLYKKAKEGHCIKIDNNCGIMDADTALKYAIDYFNYDESSDAPKAPAKTTAKATAKKSTKAPSATTTDNTVTVVKRKRTTKKRRAAKRTRR